MKYIFALLFTLLIQLSTHASVDLRMNLGRTFGDPGSLNENIPASLHMGGLTILGLDVVANPTGLGGFGGGFRFDNFSRSQEDGSNKFEYNAAVLSLLLNYRLLNTGVYAGPIMGIGLAHSSEVESKINSADTQTYSADKNRSFSLGAEGGVKLGALALGGELGFLYYKASEFKDGNQGYLVNSENGNKKHASFTGVYMRLQIGLSF